jgi:hypothetical protein
MKSSRYAKDKGSGFELTVAKLFEKELGFKFVRTPNSGGWGRCQTKGDIIAAPGNVFAWFVECKKDEGWDLWSTLFQNAGMMRGWWTKAMRQATEEDKIPVLIMAQNQKVPLALCRHGDLPCFRCSLYLRMRDEEHNALVLMCLTDFLKCLKQ